MRAIPFLLASWAIVLVSGCAGQRQAPTPLSFERPIVLLGEVHDNATQHALRLQAFKAALAGGSRPVLAMEQLDREIQPALDRLLSQTPAADADAVVALTRGRDGKATGSWAWPYYRPFIALALEYRLPIVAANVSRGEARVVMRDGLAATGFDAAVPAALLDELARGIEASHCGLLDKPTAQRMALAQVARDQYMARVLESHANRGVVLLAGNGHVRTDIGAPHWLSPATRARSQAIGVLETGDEASAYDTRVYTAPQPRPDPCDDMRASTRR